MDNFDLVEIIELCEEAQSILSKAASRFAYMQPANPAYEKTYAESVALYHAWRTLKFEVITPLCRQREAVPPS